jgi:hypothetical protein
MQKPAEFFPFIQKFIVPCEMNKYSGPWYATNRPRVCQAAERLSNVTLRGTRLSLLTAGFVEAARFLGGSCSLFSSTSYIS